MRLLAMLLAVALAACGGGTGGGGGPQPGAALLLTAGVETLEPAAGVTASPAETDRFAVPDGAAAAVYEFSTPPGQSFRFDMTVRAGGGGGDAAVALGHAADGGVAPPGGPESLSAAGVLPLAGRLETDGLWLTCEGEGQARMTVQGSIERDQTLIVECRDGSAKSYDVIRLRLGAASAINDVGDEEEGPGDDYPGIEEQAVIHSSDAWEYGLPAIAQSGDKSTIVVYEAQEDAVAKDPAFAARKLAELRLQYERATGEVTGAEPILVGDENGFFRDHELAALYNVLAIARGSANGVRLDLSFDRGASFGQSELFGIDDAWSLPIVQVDMAPDYGLTVAFWRILLTGGDKGDVGLPGIDVRAPEFESQLVIVEGRPSAVDDNGSPVAYGFSEPRVLYAEKTDLAPTLMGVRGNEHGDLAVGYGFSRFTFDPDANIVTVTTEYRCATRIGDGADFTDVLVHEEEIAAVDPSVDLEGQGDGLRILFACESAAGIRLYGSDDGGGTFTLASEVEANGAHMPTVCARTQDGALRVDLLFLAPTSSGLDLRLRHWDDFDSDAAPTDARLVRATIETEDGAELSNDFVGDIVIRQVGPHGYDAVEDGDDVAVVVHKVILKTRDIWNRFPLPVETPDEPAPGTPNRGLAQAATPPPFAPGLTDPVPEPDPAHRHQLCILYLD